MCIIVGLLRLMGMISGYLEDFSKELPVYMGSFIGFLWLLASGRKE